MDLHSETARDSCLRDRLPVSMEKAGAFRAGRGQEDRFVPVEQAARCGNLENSAVYAA